MGMTFQTASFSFLRSKHKKVVAALHWCQWFRKHVLCMGLGPLHSDRHVRHLEEDCGRVRPSPAGYHREMHASLWGSPSAPCLSMPWLLQLHSGLNAGIVHRFPAKTLCFYALRLCGWNVVVLQSCVKAELVTSTDNLKQQNKTLKLYTRKLMHCFFSVIFSCQFIKSFCAKVISTSLQANKQKGSQHFCASKCLGGTHPATKYQMWTLAWVIYFVTHMRMLYVNKISKQNILFCHYTTDIIMLQNLGLTSLMKPDTDKKLSSN